ncbi:MAG: GTP-binding protein [Sulfobacillus sp.]
MTEFKVVLIGESGVGKTSFVHRFLSGDFLKAHVPTIGVKFNPVSFDTNHGKVTFNVWDCAGAEMYRGLRDGYYIGANAAIVMFDITKRDSFARVSGHVREFLRMAPGAPIVVCGNKVDVSDRAVSPADIGKLLPRIADLCDGVKVRYFDVSAKSMYNYEQPFLYLARLLTFRDGLCFCPPNDGLPLDEDLLEEVPSPPEPEPEPANPALKKLKTENPTT